MRRSSSHRLQRLSASQNSDHRACEVKVQVLKVRNRTKSGIKFTSLLLTPYLKRSRSVEEVRPWLYFKSLSTRRFWRSFSHAVRARGKGLVISAYLYDFPAEHWSHLAISAAASLFINYKILVPHITSSQKTGNPGSNSASATTLYL